MRLKHFIIILLACISSSAFAQGERYVIRQNQDWLKLDYWKNIKPGSALDFTHMGLQDAPAGKYGWLKVVDGHFEFENLPGVDQRFYGINLCFTANYLSKREVDEFIKRLTMLGYNAIRIHHHDEGWKDPENQEKLDYLLAEAIKAGIYITTDLYVSRHVAWRTVGIDKDGMMPKEAYKGFVPCNELAFKDWCEFTESFLCHVNPYTGRAYKDEPAICLTENLSKSCRERHNAHCKDDRNNACHRNLNRDIGVLSTVHLSAYNTFCILNRNSAFCLIYQYNKHN